MHYSAVRVICTCIEKLFGNKDLAVIIHAFAAYGSLLVGFMQALARDMSQTSSLIAFSFMVAAMLFFPMGCRTPLLLNSKINDLLNFVFVRMIKK